MPVKFNLERALRGDEVVNGFGYDVVAIQINHGLSDGQFITAVHFNEFGETNKYRYSHFDNGVYNMFGVRSANDLFMKHESTDLPRVFTELDTQIRFPEGQLVL